MVLVSDLGLEAADSPSLLLQGPSSVDVWAAAVACAEARGGAAKTLRDGSTVEDAREVVELFQRRAIGGRPTVVVIDLDSLPALGQTILLKTAEEMPEWGTLILAATGYVLPTLRSRCQMILIPAGEPEVPEYVRAKPTVMSYLDAVVRHDEMAVSLVSSRWDDDARLMLWRWCTEVLADWPRLFSKAELSVVHKLGVEKFYAMVGHLRDQLSPTLTAMMLWKMR